MTNEKKNNNNFSMFGYDLLKHYDDKYIALLAMIASLAKTKGYCYASNDYFFDNMYKMNKKKLATRLDYLEENNLIVRYFRVSKNTDRQFRAKRIIVLTDLAYESYKSIDHTTKKPRSAFDGWVTRDEYNEKIGAHKEKITSNGNNDLPIEKEEENNLRNIFPIKDKHRDEINDYDEIEKLFEV